MPNARNFKEKAAVRVDIGIADLKKALDWFDFAIEIYSKNDHILSMRKELSDFINKSSELNNSFKNEIEEDIKNGII